MGLGIKIKNIPFFNNFNKGAWCSFVENFKYWDQKTYNTKDKYLRILMGFFVMVNVLLLCCFVVNLADTKQIFREENLESIGRLGYSWNAFVTLTYISIFNWKKS